MKNHWKFLDYVRLRSLSLANKHSKKIYLEEPKFLSFQLTIMFFHIFRLVVVTLTTSAYFSERIKIWNSLAKRHVVILQFNGWSRIVNEHNPLPAVCNRGIYPLMINVFNTLWNSNWFFHVTVLPCHASPATFENEFSSDDIVGLGNAVVRC